MFHNLNNERKKTVRLSKYSTWTKCHKTDRYKLTDNFNRNTTEFQLSKSKCRSSHLKRSQETHFAKRCTEKQIRYPHGNVLFNNFQGNGMTIRFHLETQSKSHLLYSQQLLFALKAVVRFLVVP